MNGALFQCFIPHNKTNDIQDDQKNAIYCPDTTFSSKCDLFQRKGSHFKHFLENVRFVQHSAMILAFYLPQGYQSLFRSFEDEDVLRFILKYKT